MNVLSFLRLLRSTGQQTVRWHKATEQFVNNRFLIPNRRLQFSSENCYYNHVRGYRNCHFHNKRVYPYHLYLLWARDLMGYKIKIMLIWPVIREHVCTSMLQAYVQVC